MWRSPTFVPRSCHRSVRVGSMKGGEKVNGVEVCDIRRFTYPGSGERDLGVRRMCDPEHAAKPTTLSKLTPACAQASVCGSQSRSRYEGGRIRAWTDVTLVRGRLPLKAGFRAAGRISVRTWQVSKQEASCRRHSILAHDLARLTGSCATLRRSMSPDRRAAQDRQKASGCAIDTGREEHALQ